ncbi:MAG: hypothetical protein WDM96_03875 [Lacunisphaera sp.]
MAKTGGADAAAQRDELARARRDLVEMATLQEENIRLRQAAATADDLKAKTTQLARDNEQLTSLMNSNRSDLDKAQAHAADVEKQLAEALTVRTSAASGAGKQQAELDEANRTVEKLNGTVAELTAANEKLEKDLDTAQKSTAAALAAQSQAGQRREPGFLPDGNRHAEHPDQAAGVAGRGRADQCRQGSFHARQPAAADARDQQVAHRSQPRLGCGEGQRHFRQSR